MDKKDWKHKKLESLTKTLVKSYDKQKGINQIDGLNLPNSDHVYEIIHDFFKIIFPGFIGRESITSSGVSYYVGTILEGLFDKLYYQVNRALEYRCPNKTVKACKTCDCSSRAYGITVDVLEKIPHIRGLLREDVKAAFDGDPAAQSFDEIIVSYPYVKAITVHRIAHLLYKQNVPMIPRIMAEWAHKETGIDIHPGANIGHAFFIDHGTGVVIGETTTIGNNVKLYHGVTLGARSTADVEELRGAKRHPTIEAFVTIYPNATILGGDTVIGKGATIGGNTWITSSVKPGTVVVNPKPDLIVKEKRK
ncbi:MAG: serine acetyltransferase [Fibrobacteres bacterium]|nr:serine acetyltransferase [Fibrobacterota bacterium]